MKREFRAIQLFCLPIAAADLNLQRKLRTKGAGDQSSGLDGLLGRSQ